MERQGAKSSARYSNRAPGMISRKQRLWMDYFSKNKVCAWLDKSKWRPEAPGQVEINNCPGAARQVEMSSWSNWIIRNVVLEQRDRSKGRPGAAGQVETLSGSGKVHRTKSRISKVPKPQMNFIR